MRNRISNRVWRHAALCTLLGVAVSGTALPSSSVSSTATESAAPKPHSAKSKHTKSASNGSSATHKSTARTSAGKTASHKSTRQKTSGTRGKKGSKNPRSRKRGQQVIDHERARSIQEALIRERYLQGEPSGSWDSATQAAMQRYQADQGWQSKTTPDSRALIKLGLGPSKDHLLNPESAMTSSPAAGDSKSATKPDAAENSLPQQ